MPVTSPYAARLATVPVRPQELVVRGATTRLWVYGDPTATRRILLLHGLRGDHHGLAPVVAHLIGRAPDVAVVLPDLPGFGTSAPLPGDRHDIAGYAAWTRDLLAALSADRAAAPSGTAGPAPDGWVLAGHSFGSIVATAALSGTDLPVRALALINPIAASALAGPRPGMTRVTVLYHRLAAALPERAGTALLRHRLITRVASVAMASTPDRALRRWIHAEHDLRFSGFASREVLLQAFDASIRHDVAEFAAGVDVPVLLVAAERDDIAPLPSQHALASRFADAAVVVVPGVGHLAHYEAPDAVAAALAGFS